MSYFRANLEKYEVMRFTGLRNAFIVVIWGVFMERGRLDPLWGSGLGLQPCFLAVTHLALTESRFLMFLATIFDASIIKILAGNSQKALEGRCKLVVANTCYSLSTHRVRAVSSCVGTPEKCTAVPIKRKLARIEFNWP